jgi:hypothetical protein
LGAHISRIGRVSSMSITFRNAAVVSVVIAFAIVTASRADAEEKEQTSVKTNVVTAYKTTLQIGEGHELTQALEISDIKFSDPDFGSAREWVYVHTDSIGGTGKITAYFVDYFDDGSQTYGRGEGTVKTTASPDGSWQADWEGTYSYLGGTGRFKDMKGGGTFKGSASSTEPAKEEAEENVTY